jgi:hypothetical protein
MERVGQVLSLLGIQRHVPGTITAARHKRTLEDQGTQQVLLLCLARPAWKELDLRQIVAPWAAG